MISAAIFGLVFNDLSQSPRQRISCSVHGKYVHPVKKRTLANAVILPDLVADYPVNWIDHYLSTEISLSSGTKIQQAAGTDMVLNPSQKALLRQADFTDEVRVEVSYTCRNAVSNRQVENKLAITFTVVPDTEAKFPGGEARLIGNRSRREVTTERDTRHADPRRIDLGLLLKPVNRSACPVLAVRIDGKAPEPQGLAGPRLVDAQRGNPASG